MTVDDLPKFMDGFDTALFEALKRLHCKNGCECRVEIGIVPGKRNGFVIAALKDGCGEHRCSSATVYFTDKGGSTQLN